MRAGQAVLAAPGVPLGCSCTWKWAHLLPAACLVSAGLPPARPHELVCLQLHPDWVGTIGINAGSLRFTKA